MSTRTGGRWSRRPDDLTDTVCVWTMCRVKIPYRFLDAGIHLCQEHALHVWSRVDQMNRCHEVTPAPTPKPFQPGPDAGSVYYIRIGDRVKIGHTIDLEKRLSTYPPNMEILLIRWGGRALERAEHKRFAEHRTDGREWFHANDRVMELIDQVRDDADNEWEPEWFQRRRHTPQVVAHSRLKSEGAGHGH